MANLKEVKERIKGVTSTQQITRAMKMVAAAKLRRAQDKIIQLRPYSEKLSAILSNVSAGSSDEAMKTYAQEREVKNVLIVPVTSDRGLCGAFNSNINKALKVVASAHEGATIHVMPIGKKAFDMSKKQKFTSVNAYWGMFSKLSFETAREAAEFAMNGYEEGKYDKVILIYNEFKNVATQIIRSEQLLPIVQVEQEGETSTTGTDYIFEPSKDFIIEDLIPKSLKIQFYKAILESNASEHGARMTAMGKATDNAGDLLKDLKLMYNRTRQAAITKEILEIVGGAEALAADN